MLKIINSFSGEFSFLSNFAPCIIVKNNYEIWYSAEHLYQASKTTEEKERLAIKNCDTPGQAKRMGRKATLRLDWDEVKYSIMLKIIRLKFIQKSELAHLLRSTHDTILIEGNNWHDNL